MGVEKVFKGVLGILLAVGGMYLLTRWWADFMTLLRGGVPVLIILIGLVFIILAFEK